ncbi:MAG TPA: hypothetical protein VE974_17310 [Thermoanaerobaculia bacterium]|nr:hypothetical protein [Thermoanaerobaculia bacterium]
MTERRLAVRSLVLLALLVACSTWTACRRAEGQWRGSVEQKGGTKVVSNEGEGLDAGKVREELRPIWKIGGQPGQPVFSLVMWVELDAAGNAYVLDYRPQQITKLTPNGTVAGQFGTRGEQPGGLSKSRRMVWVDKKLYFANEGNGRIEVLGENGEVFPPVELPQVKNPGEIFFANDQFYVSRRFVPDGSFIHAYDRSWKLSRAIRPAAPMADRLDVIRSHNTVCTAPDGIWILHMLLNQIVKVGWDGQVLLETSRDLDWNFPKDEKGRVIPELLVHRACAVDPAGNLYVIYSNPEDWKRGNDVYKFAPDGRLRQKAFTLPVHNASMMRFDREGNFYFADGTSLTKAKIERIEEK